MTVQLIRARSADESALQNLLQLYTHDFSGLWSGTKRGEIHADGRFEEYPLHDYRHRPNWMTFFIRQGGELAGFCLVNDHIHSAMPVERSISEFFILRKHRKQGVGRSAALQVFTDYPGSWEVAVARKNVKAQAFWRATIRAFAAASEICELDLHSDRWDGPVFQFKVR